MQVDNVFPGLWYLLLAEHPSYKSRWIKESLMQGNVFVNGVYERLLFFRGNDTSNHVEINLFYSLTNE